MKKMISVSVLTLTLLLTACGDRDTAEPVDSFEPESGATDIAAKLNDDLFITLSAEILCLPNNNTEADAAEVETMAKQIIALENITEEDFNVYQQIIEADPVSRDELSIAVVGKMSDFCTIVSVETGETVEIDGAMNEEEAVEIDATSDDVEKD